MTAVRPPDAVTLVATYLRAQDHLAGVAVVSVRPDDVLAQAPLLLVEAVGEPVSSRLPWARSVRWHLGMQVWAGEGRAVPIMRGAMTALVAARGVRLPEGGWIVRVDLAADPTEVPDRTVGDDVQRVVMTIDVTVRS